MYIFDSNVGVNRPVQDSRPDRAKGPLHVQVSRLTVNRAWSAMASARLGVQRILCTVRLSSQLGRSGSRNPIY